MVALFRFQVKTVRYLFQVCGFSPQPKIHVESTVSVLLATVDHIWMYQCISESTIP